MLVLATFSRDLSVVGTKRDRIIAKSGSRTGEGHCSLSTGEFAYKGRVSQAEEKHNLQHEHWRRAEGPWAAVG